MGWVMYKGVDDGKCCVVRGRSGNTRGLRMVRPMSGIADVRSVHAGGNLAAVMPPEKTEHVLSWDPANRPSSHAPPDLGFSPKDAAYAYDFDGMMRYGGGGGFTPNLTTWY